MYRPTGAEHGKNPKGIFHEFDDDLCHAIIQVTMRDVSVTCKRNNHDLKLQAKARHKKEELTREKNMTKTTDEYFNVM